MQHTVLVPQLYVSMANMDIHTARELLLTYWLEDIIDSVETAVKNVPYPIIKRSDEKWIAGAAKSYPMFVEDAIRHISHVLHKKKNILDYYVRCTHEESIHPSNAVAVNWRGVEGGFDENTYI